jgi:hypothetical protein
MQCDNMTSGVAVFNFTIPGYNGRAEPEEIQMSMLPDSLTATLAREGSGERV